MMDTELNDLSLDDDFRASYYGFLDAEDQDIWRARLQGQVVFLKRQGWSKSVIEKGFLRALKVPDERDKHLSYLEDRMEESQLFGSELFQNLWRIGGRESRVKELKDLLEAAMTVATMPDNLSGTIAETERLIARISPDIEPADPFWKEFSKTVQKAFPGQTLAGEGKLNRQLHQFRYVISSQQAQWVRQHYRKEGMTDAQALAVYIRNMDNRNGVMQELGVDNTNYYYAYNMTESARLHNKIALKPSDATTAEIIYPDGIPLINFKILLHFHTEFILDELGHFLNEVDVEGVTENGILNGASFNYASQNNARHRALDIAPVGPHDPTFRKKLARQKHARFFSPNRLTTEKGSKQANDWLFSYFNPKGYFAKDGQSGAQRVTKAVKHFEKMIDEGLDG
ncbi:hypothetical protein J2S23_002024 [Streptococcus moroccensis]|uniref:DUF3114 domain-containing protein n=2 Tax=Streptococcus moroccensis TaxID=1451356 RepID=A0ABT9YTY1_9STRE|nr:hypothetical protein [Streptococcus moroccensis]